MRRGPDICFRMLGTGDTILSNLAQTTGNNTSHRYQTRLLVHELRSRDAGPPPVSDVSPILFPSEPRLIIGQPHNVVELLSDNSLGLFVHQQRRSEVGQVVDALLPVASSLSLRS